MKRVLMLTAHFPPESGASSHRVRLLAPHLPAHGWEPTVVTIDPRDYEARLDPELAELLPGWLRIVRARAWDPRRTRRLGFGDLGLRALTGLSHAAARLLRDERYDVLFVPVPPFYVALLGPWLQRRFGVPFVLDYGDPWVNEWGRTVGPAPGGRPNLRARLSRLAALALEPIAVRGVAAMTAVSDGTFDGVRARNRSLRDKPCVTLPFGCEPADFARIAGRRNPYFDATDGDFHLVCVGTLAPLGFETLRAVLSAARSLRARHPRLRLHFYGTSNQFAGDSPERVMPVARELGVADVVDEIAPRIDYLDALACMSQATALLLMGSTERHYTASRLFPVLLAERPLLAVFHSASSVVELLQRTGRPPSVRLVTYDDDVRAGARGDAIAAEMEALLADPVYDRSVMDLEVVRQHSAAALAGRLAAVLDEACRPSR